MCSTFITRTMFVALGVLAVDSFAQRAGIPTNSVADSEELYSTSLNSLLPLQPIPKTPEKGRVFNIAIRYQRAFAPESEILLALDLDSSPRVEYKELDRPLAHVIGESNATIGEIIQRVMVRRKNVDLSPTKLLGWQEQFMKNVGRVLLQEAPDTRASYKTRSVQLVPDADAVEFLYQGGETQLQGRVTEPRGDALIKWTSALRSEIAGLPASPRN